MAQRRSRAFLGVSPTTWSILVPVVALLAGALFAAEHGDLLHVGDRLAKLVDTDIAGPALGQFDGAAKACRALEEGEVPGG